MVLCTSAYSDNIKNFKIENISIGDSALDYFAEAKIENSELDWHNFSYKEYSTSLLPGKGIYDWFKISYKSENYFAYDEKERDNILESNKNKNKPNISRFKGLGEMPANQLRQTTMETKERKLIKLKLKDGSKENKKTENLFESLMGKTAEKRFIYIQENANFIYNLDC